MADPISTSSSNYSSSPSGDAYPTVLGPDASFKGELTFEKGMRLMGRFEGKINTPGRLQVSREARMSADVDAGAITVEGEVRGNLVAADRIELKSTARYEGDLRTTKLVVEEGAVFTGNVSVGPEAVKKGPRTSTTGNAAFNAPIPAPSSVSSSNGASTPVAAK
jgi:cytoskeletal protein CcmA (bactofilin family)